MRKAYQTNGKKGDISGKPHYPEGKKLRRAGWWDNPTKPKEHKRIEKGKGLQGR